jgi:ribosomal protein L21E
LYNQISARLGRAATFAELSRAMNLYRVSIDSDIKANGAVNQFKIKKFPDINFKGRTSGLRQKLTAYSINVQSGQKGKSIYDSQRFSGAKGAYNNNVSFTPKPLQVVRTPYNSDMNKRQNNRPNGQKWDPRNRFNNKNRFNGANNSNQIKSCSYCGMRGHKAVDCTNIVSDSGKRIDLLPTQGTCSNCPSRISPRLHHPEALCPYRVGGPLNKNRNWQSLPPDNSDIYTLEYKLSNKNLPFFPEIENGKELKLSLVKDVVLKPKETVSHDFGITLNIKDHHVGVVLGGKLIFHNFVIKISTHLLWTRDVPIRVNITNLTEKEIYLTPQPIVSVFIVNIKGNQELKIETAKIILKTKKNPEYNGIFTCNSSEGDCANSRNWEYFLAGITTSLLSHVLYDKCKGSGIFNF